MPVKLLTYNPGTAGELDTKLSWQQQFEQGDVAAAGMQETRDRESSQGIFRENWWIAASAGTKKRHYGCQLWLSLTTAWAVNSNGSEICADPKHIFVLESSERLLVVRMELPCFSVLFVVAYGHYGKFDVATVTGYWQGVVKTVTGIVRKEERVRNGHKTS